MAAAEELGIDEQKSILPEFERMIEILGLKIPVILPEQKSKIDELIENRKKFRNEKNFTEADKIRDILNEMNIELIDHKGRTIWMKKEKIKSDH